MKFQFGNKFIYPSPTKTLSQRILISQVTFDPIFVERTEKLENALGNANLTDFCNYKISENKDKHELELAWKLVRLLFDNDKHAKIESTSDLFGYQLSLDSLSDQLSRTTLSHTTSPSTNRDKSLLTQSPSWHQSESIQSEHNEHLEIAQRLFQENFHMKTTQDNIGSMINKSILTRNYSHAVENCISSGNWNEAFLICFFFENDLIFDTLNKYFEFCSNKPTDLSSLLWIMIIAKISPEEDFNLIFEKAIANIDLDYWREIIVFLTQQLYKNKYSSLMNELLDKLASRLIEKYNETEIDDWLYAAMYCFILNGNYKHLIDFEKIVHFLDLIELFLIMSSKGTLEPNELTEKYARLLVREGKLPLALKYIKEGEFKQRIVGSTSQRRRFPSYQNRPSYTNHSFQNANTSYSYNRFPPANTQYSNYPNSLGQSYNFNYPTSSSVPPQYVPSQYGPTQYGSKQYGSKQYGSKQYGSKQYATTQYATAQYSPTQYSPTNSLSSQNWQYGNSTNVEPVTAGWNDPPTINPQKAPKRRTLSFSNSFEQPNVPIFTPPPSDLSNQHVHEQPRPPSRVLSRKQSLTPVEVTLSPQNQELFSIFENLFHRIQQTSNLNSSNTKRKLDEIKIKLDAFKVKLASDSQLSEAAMNGLKSIASSINDKDYWSAMMYHNNLVASTSFGETSSFLPTIKILLHLAQQQNV